MKNTDADRLREQTTRLVTSNTNERYKAGWRSGKPVEDPEKTKRWGFITAKPSEYLICIKDGRINPRASGRGARVFKWPWEAIAIVPTTLQQLEFTADQVTRERVGVTVTGIAVFRIVQPELAFQVLNFSYGERASEKLAETLGEMFIGASRRLIANLTLDECLMKRKESIASFLMTEIAPVVSGSGSSEDSTDQGWGVVIDTIEIQDVHIQSQRVFADLQAPFRAELATRAEMAELERQREVAERRAETERRTVEAVLQSERETRMLRARAEAEAAETEAAETVRAEQARARAAAAELERKEVLARKRLEVEGGIALQEAESKAYLERSRGLLAQERELASIKVAEEKRRAVAQAELAALVSETELAGESHKALTLRLEQERERQTFQQETDNALKERRTELELEARRREIGVKQVEVELELRRQREVAGIEQVLNQGRAMRDMVNNALPQIASAFKQNFGSIHYTHLGGAGADGNPLQLVASAFTQVMAVARGFGFDPGRLMATGAGGPAGSSGPATGEGGTAETGSEMPGAAGAEPLED